MARIPIGSSDYGLLRYSLNDSSAEQADPAELAGFVAYSERGHIDLLYVVPARARRGVASRLYAQVEAALRQAGVPWVYTEASAIARPFFERQGFRVVEEQHVERHGIFLRRYAMQKHLLPAERR